MESYNIEPFCLTSLALHNILKAHLCGGMYQYFTLFWQNTIPLYGFTTFYLFITWWAFGFFPHFGYHEHSCTSFCVDTVLSFLLCRYLGVELLGYMITLCLTFQGTAKLFFKVAVAFYNPTRNVWWFSCFHILTNTSNYLSFWW